MRFPAASLVWAFCALQTGCFSVPAATIRAPNQHDGNSLERRDRGSMASPSRPSYVIYDGDVNSLQNNRERPQILNRPRPWHLEFNNHQQYQPSQRPPYSSPSYQQDYQQPPYASSSFVHDKYQPQPPSYGSEKYPPQPHLPPVPPYGSDKYQPQSQQPSYSSENYPSQPQLPPYGSDKYYPQQQPSYGNDKYPQAHMPSYGNDKYQPQRQQPYAHDKYAPVYSNLIQVLENPRKYYGPYDSKTYQEPERGYYNYPSYPRPSEVPKYEVIYPYDNQPKSHFYGENLPDRFPTTFMPEKNFKVKVPPLEDGLRGGGDIGFHRTQTVNYFGSTYDPDGGEDRRSGRREQCNYIKLNEKGFPRGNELCGRSISDILLSPDYPTTGGLTLEHRKRYRGVQQGRSLDPNVAVMEEKKSETNKTEEAKTRQKRSAQMYPSRFLDRCCDGNSRVNRPYEEYGGYGSYDSGNRGYGFGSYNAYNRGNDYRPYGRANDYSFGFGGQYQDNYRDDYGDETSSRGLTTYMSQSDRNRGHQQESEENEGGSYGSSSYNMRGRKNENNTQRHGSNGSSHENHNQSGRSSQNSSRNSGSGNYGDNDRQSEYGSNNGNFQSTTYMRGRDGDYFGSSGSGSRGFSGTGYGSSSGGQYDSRDFGSSYGRRSGSDGFYSSYKK